MMLVVMEHFRQILPFFISTCCVILTRSEIITSASFATGQKFLNRPLQGNIENFDFIPRGQKTAGSSVSFSRTKVSLVSTGFREQDLGYFYRTLPANDTAFTTHEISLSDVGKLQNHEFIEEFTGMTENSIINKAYERSLSARDKSKFLHRLASLPMRFVGSVVKTRNKWDSVRLTFPAVKSKVQRVQLVDITWLKAHEEIVSYDRVRNLRDAILEWGVYKLPLLVDARSGAILDGHHRYAVGCELGLSKLPVVLVDYLGDESIQVDVWPDCGIDCLTKEDVIRMSLSDKVFPPKTSRHSCVDSMSPINVCLKKLQ